MFNQFKAASDMLKNMSPEERKDLLEQAKNSRGMLEDTVRKVLAEEIKKQGLVTKEEVERMFKNRE